MTTLRIEGKRVALIQCPRPVANFYSTLPVGLLALASCIKQYGYQPIIIDLYLFTVFKKNFSNYFKQMAEEILRHDSQVLGFSVLCSNFAIALLIAEECKKMAPELPIIFGGPEVCFEEVEVLKTFKQVEIIVRGEGEITLVEVLKALEDRKPLSEIQGITYRENERIIRNPDRPLIKDLDQLPLLDFSLVPRLEMYTIEIEGGRGCPYSCTFCATSRICRRKFRIKSPQRLIQEIKEARRFSKNPYIAINHDHFLASRKFADEFLSLITNEGLSWGCNSRLDALDETMIKKLKQAGCRELGLGIEAGSAEMQRQIKKNLPLANLPRVLELLYQNKIELTLSFIIGFPNENESQISKTLLMALKAKLFHPFAEIQIFLFTFLKGSELYTKAKEDFTQYEFRETPYSSLTTNLSAEISLIKKYPRIFPSFYYIGKEGIPQNILQKITYLYIFLIRSYVCPTLSLLEYFSMTPYQLGLKLISFFDAEGVEWAPIQGYHQPQYVSPFRKFIKKYASPLYKEFFWWDEAFEQWEKRRNRCGKT